MLAREAEEYAGSRADDLPIAAYAGLITMYCTLVGLALAVGARRRLLPRSIAASDLALLGVATHRASRILTRDRIAAPLRMPFTRYEGTSGAGEVKERPRGRGLRKALGGLLTCQFCAGPWLAGMLLTGLVLRPRETRLVASALTITTVSDFMHQLYAFARRGSP